MTDHKPLITIFGPTTDEDTGVVCAIKVLSLQVKPTDATYLVSESAKDLLMSTVLCYTREGWRTSKQCVAVVSALQSIKINL